MSNPYVFIVGCPRSGTTLLERMVDAHPQIAIILESHWIPKWFQERRGLTREGYVTPELITQLLDYHRFARMQIGRDELLALVGNTKSVPYSSFVRGVFDLYGKARGKTLVGDKTPGYVRYLHILHDLWPGARFVHLIRDGRDVCLSVADWPKTDQKEPGTFPTWQDDRVSTTAVWWELMVRLGRQAGNLLGPELYREIRYESLVTRPEEECAALCAFLGVPYDEAMLRFHEGRTSAKLGLDAKHAWLPVTSGLRDWRSQMPAVDVERFEAAVGGLLDALGYPRAFPHPRSEMLASASTIRGLLAREPYWLRHSREDPVAAHEVAGDVSEKRSEREGSRVHQ